MSPLYSCVPAGNDFTHFLSFTCQNVLCEKDQMLYSLKFDTQHLKAAYCHYVWVFSSIFSVQSRLPAKQRKNNPYSSIQWNDRRALLMRESTRLGQFYPESGCKQIYKVTRRKYLEPQNHFIFHRNETIDFLSSFLSHLNSAVIRGVFVRQEKKDQDPRWGAETGGLIIGPSKSYGNKSHVTRLGSHGAYFPVCGDSLIPLTFTP